MPLTCTHGAQRLIMGVSESLAPGTSVRSPSPNQVSSLVLLEVVKEKLIRSLLQHRLDPQAYSLSPKPSHLKIATPEFQVVLGELYIIASLRLKRRRSRKRNGDSCGSQVVDIPATSYIVYEARSWEKPYRTLPMKLNLGFFLDPVVLALIQPRGL